MVLKYTMDSARHVDPESECLYKYIRRKYNHAFLPHTHDYYEIFLILDGSVNHVINGETENLPEGSLVFIRPNDVHGYKYYNPEKRDTEYINLTFSANVADKLFAYLEGDIDTAGLLSSPMPTTVRLSSEEKNKVLELLNQLNVEAWDDKKSLRLKMKQVLADIFSAYFSQLRKDEDKEKKPYWLEKLTEEMSQYDNFIGGIERMCQISGKSREHISRSIKKYLGITAIEFLNELKINYAANLLINSNYSIIDICYMIGFDSVGYFYKVFKKCESVTPKEFRNKYSVVMPH